MTAELATDRLLLRRWRQEDREPFAALNADPEVMRYFPKRLTTAESDELADHADGRLAEHGWGLWAVELRATEAFLGFTGLAVPRFQAHFTPAVEVLWRLTRGAWGFGYATEAARPVLELAFAPVAEGRGLGLSEVVSFTASGNRRSRAVMTRLGMTHDEADDFDHPALWAGSPLRRHVLYRLPARWS